MITVALTALTLGMGSWIIPLWRQSDEYRFLARFHDWMRQQSVSGGHTEAALYHLRLKQKYEQARFQPWLPVEPDPPEP